MVTMIALAVLMVLVVGAIRFTGTSRVATVSKVRGDKLTACAETARRYLLSRLRLFGVAVTNLQLDTVAGTTWAKLPDDTVAARQTKLGPGHYGDNLTTATVSKVGIIPSTSMGTSFKQVRDLANVLGPRTTGGQYYRVAMKCEEPGGPSGDVGGGHEAEIEFVFRYGL